MNESDYNKAVNAGDVTFLQPQPAAPAAPDGETNTDLLQYVPVLQSLRAPHGSIATVPTLLPKNFIDQIQLVDDGVVKALYIYINNTWQKFLPAAAAPSSTFGGSVVSNAAGSFFPSGWSVSHTGTGIYTVTHNLGTTNYALTVSPDVFHTSFAVMYSKTSNDFGVATFVWSSGAATDSDFDFILTK